MEVGALIVYTRGTSEGKHQLSAEAVASVPKAGSPWGLSSINPTIWFPHLFLNRNLDALAAESSVSSGVSGSSELLCRPIVTRLVPWFNNVLSRLFSTTVQSYRALDMRYETKQTLHSQIISRWCWRSTWVRNDWIRKMISSYLMGLQTAVWGKPPFSKHKQNVFKCIYIYMLRLPALLSSKVSQMCCISVTSGSRQIWVRGHSPYFFKLNYIDYLLILF